MKTKYWLCKREEIFFSFDSATGKRESLHTSDKEEARILVVPTIGKLQLLLIESNTQLVIVLDRPEGQVVGLVTLHDLLRAQTMMAQRSEDS